MARNAILTKFYGKKQFRMMTDWLAFVHDSVSAPDFHCLTISWQKQRFDSIKTVKNANVSAFYGILRTFTAIKWDSYPTQYFETLLNVSLRSKYTFSDRLWLKCLYISLRKNNRWPEMPYWRNFTAKNNSEWWRIDLHLCMIVSQRQIFTVWPFPDRSSGLIV